jgi:cytochrome c peroxidase
MKGLKIKFVLFSFLAIAFFALRSSESGKKKYSKEKLGELLFNEKILSLDSTVSCASCHKPEFAFSDTSAFSIGIGGKPTKRNTPSVLNMKNRPYYFWDGRASTLSEQSLMPIQNPDEMNLSIREAVKRLNQNAFYVDYFKSVFKRAPDSLSLATAFESVQEERGRKVFLSDKSRCFDCHFLVDFTNDDFKNIGLYNGILLNDKGRFNITKNPDDLGKFKTPGLRNIAVTAPYMHNGMFKTLEEVVDYYNNPSAVVPDRINIDSTLLKPLGLTTSEKADLVAFLKTLTDKKFSKN